MSDVLELASVSVVRGSATLLHDITWDVAEGERWVVLGPNGAGKTTLLQLASGRMHPTTGLVGILGEILGAVDVFELRPRIGLASAALAERLPARESVHDIVVTASYGVVGRWRESYDDARPRAGRAAAGGDGDGRVLRADLRHAERGRAQAGPDRPGPDDRPGADAARRAGGRSGPRRPRGPGPPPGRLAADPLAPAMVLVTHHVEEIPPGFTHVLLLREGGVVAPARWARP